MTATETETTGDLARAFARRFRWMVPVSVLSALALWALDVSGMQTVGVGLMILIALLVPVVLGPLTWVRDELRGRKDKAFWGCLGLSVLWAIASLTAFLAIAYVIGSQRLGR